MGKEEARKVYKIYEKKEKEMRAKIEKLNTDCNKKRHILENQIDKITAEKMDKVNVAWDK